MEKYFNTSTEAGVAEIRELLQHAYAQGWATRGPFVSEAQSEAWRRELLGTKSYEGKQD